MEIVINGMPVKKELLKLKELHTPFIYKLKNFLNQINAIKKLKSNEKIDKWKELHTSFIYI